MLDFNSKVEMAGHLIPQMTLLVMNSITVILKVLFVASTKVQEAANIHSIFPFLEKVLAISRF